MLADSEVRLASLILAITAHLRLPPPPTPFPPPARRGRKPAPKHAALQNRACELRRQGAPLASIHATLQGEGFDVSESYLFRILGRAGLTTVRHRRPTPQ